MNQQEVTNLLRGISIFLIGMMGTGKTTVGQILARQLNYRFCDTDELIERVTNQTIQEIFATAGEEKFRVIESQVLGELAAYTKSVIATGGGIIQRQINWSYLHHGVIIWLDAPIEVLQQRLAEDTSRPLRQQLESLLDKRRPLYAQADLHIQLQTEQNPEQVVSEIIEQIPTVLKPNRRPDLYLNN